MFARALNLFPALTSRFFGTGFVGDAMRRSASASFWVTISLGVLTILRLGSNLVLARLLTPDAFGIVAAASIFISALTLLTDIGLSHSVVKSERGEDPAFLHTLFTVQIVRGLFNAAIVVLIGLVIGTNRHWFPADSTYALPLTAWVIAAVGLKMALTSFVSPSRYVAQRRLEQRKISILGIVARGVDIPVMFLAAWLGMGAWALVIGQLANAVVMIIGSHTYLPGPKMRLAFERKAFAEMFHFGKWLIVASTASIVLFQGNQIIFSAAFSVRDFSLFVVAGIWINAVREIINKVINSVAFAAVASAVREQPEAISRVYKRFRLLSEAVVLAAFFVVMVGHSWFFDFFYPPDFEAAKVFVPFVAISLLFTPYTLLNQISLAAGDSFNFMWIKVAGAVGVVTLVPAALHLFGQMPAVLTASLIGAVTVVPSMLAARRHMKLDLMTEARLPIFTAAACTAIIVFYL